MADADDVMAATVAAAGRCLPNGLSDWQKSWCTQEVISIYLRGRKGDPERAGEILAEALQWREHHYEILTGRRIPRWQGDLRVLTRSEGGHPLVYMSLRHKILQPGTVDGIEHLAAVLEAAVKAMTYGAQTFDWVIDFYGYGSRTFDVKSAGGLFEVLRQPYRDRLRSSFLVDAPLAFRMIWPAASRFLGNDVRRKIRFVTNQEALTHFEDCGGTRATADLEHWMNINRSSSSPSVDNIRLPSEILPDQGDYSVRSRPASRGTSRRSFTRASSRSPRASPRTTPQTSPRSKPRYWPWSSCGTGIGIVSDTPGQPALPNLLTATHQVPTGVSPKSARSIATSRSIATGGATARSLASSRTNFTRTSINACRSAAAVSALAASEEEAATTNEAAPSAAGIGPTRVQTSRCCVQSLIPACACGRPSLVSEPQALSKAQGN